MLVVYIFYNTIIIIIIMKIIIDSWSLRRITNMVMKYTLYKLLWYHFFTTYTQTYSHAFSTYAHEIPWDPSHSIHAHYASQFVFTNNKAQTDTVCF
jgi:hypothetical protein